MHNTHLSSFFVLLISCLISVNTFATNHDTSDDLSSELLSAIPIMQCPSFVWLKPNESRDPSRTGYPSVAPGSPECKDPIVTFTDDIKVINACHFEITRTWRAQDPDNPNLFTTCIQTIKEIDEEAPYLENLPQDTMIYTNDINCHRRVFWESPSIYDNYLIDFIEITGKNNGSTFTVKSGDIFPEGITVVTYTLYDFCGNISSYSFEINIMCATCHVECPDNACLPIGSDVSPDVLGYAYSYSGNVNCGAADIDYSDIMIETGCNGVSTSLRIWSAVFETMPEFEFTCVQTIELKNENELSLYNCPQDIVAKNNYTPVHWAEPFAVNGSNITILTSNYQPGQIFPLGITTVIYTATDYCGNETTCSFKVSVLDDATYDECPEDIVTSCDGNGTATVNWTPPVYDGDCTECPKGKALSGFIYVGSFNGSNYYCSRKHQTFAKAKSLASKYGGYIASINSKEENDYLASHIGSSSAIIGLSDIKSEGNFQWESGESLDYENWYTSQPNNGGFGNQDVVELMKSGKWNDIEKSEQREFVLEIPCEFVTQIEGPSPGQELAPGNYYVLYHIADGCGLDKYCGFNISVSAGITMTCIENVYIEIPYSEDGTTITWDDLQVSSCCDQCTNENNCIQIDLIYGQPSGSYFERNSSTDILLRATDLCGNTKDCAFNVSIGTKPGSKISTVFDEISEVKSEVNHHQVQVNVEESTEQATYREEAIDNTLESPSRKLKSSKIYPNPASISSTLEIENFENIHSIEIVDFSGRLVERRIHVLSSVQQFDLSSWSNGVYFVSIYYNNGYRENIRLVKN